jgi:hypothetical protein
MASIFSLAEYLRAMHVAQINKMYYPKQD